MVKFYFINAGTFSTYQPALQLSNTISQSDGAGYIYFDGNYHVLVGFYSDSDDAESVLSNLQNEYPYYSILTISVKPFQRQKNLSSSENTTIENLLNQSKNLIFKYEKILIDYSTNQSNLNHTKLQIENLYNELTPYCDEFISRFKGDSKFNIAKDYINKMITSIKPENFESSTNKSSTLRYNLIDFVINRYHLLSCF